MPGLTELLLMAATGLATSAPQVPAGIQAGTLTVEVRYLSPTGAEPLAQAFVCVGAGTDQLKFGSKPTDTAGKAVFDAVPIGTEVYVTAAKAGWATPQGGVEGRRIKYVAKSSPARLVLDLPLGAAPGPSCGVPIGQEPPPAKALPEAEWVKPALRGTLKSSGGPVAVSRDVQIYTHSDSTGPYILVDGPPTTYQVAVDETIDGYTTTHEVAVAKGRMPAITVRLPAGDGLKTINLKLRNDKGSSETYSVQQQLSDLNTPCTYSFRRSSEFKGGTDIDTEHTLGRGLTRTYGGDGVYLQSIYNKGPHRIEFSFRALNDSGHEQGASITQSVEPGDSGGALKKVNMKQVRCF